LTHFVLFELYPVDEVAFFIHQLGEGWQSFGQGKRKVKEFGTAMAKLKRSIRPEAARSTGASRVGEAEGADHGVGSAKGVADN
jgi:hypothetical protein